jgi:hypothetical protein
VTDGTPDVAQSGAAGQQQASLAQAAFFALRQPAVLILLLIAFFTSISGKPLDGVLMVTVAILLAFDAARTRLRGRAQQPAAGGPAAAGWALPGGQETERAGMSARRVLTAVGLVAAGLLYAVVVGSFKRYSWPATTAVLALGSLMIAIGWQGPLRHRAALTGQALRRAWMWGVVLVAGGLWELSSLLQQPSITTDSYAHPTISALTDPVLASHPGRSLILGVWLLLGWFLAGR